MNTLSHCSVSLDEANYDLASQKPSPLALLSPADDLNDALRDYSRITDLAILFLNRPEQQHVRFHNFKTLTYSIQDVLSRLCDKGDTAAIVMAFSKNFYLTHQPTPEAVESMTEAIVLAAREVAFEALGLERRWGSFQKLELVITPKKKEPK